ncbi:MAG TPA: methyltransferase domain-containing protein [Aestuariivirga sp.]|jgi:SAM-dependent methyltransferase|nr:methyltransferase domain-containing protein [Aestuariivirga sp.]
MDVVELREFYASPLGNATRRLISAKLKPQLGPLSDACVLGLGFATPYLDDLPSGTGRNIAFMMARQGVIHWPREGPVQSSLVDEFDLPLLESAVDLALVVHGLELTDSPIEMLQEVWRVMAPQGRLVLVVPNRRGLWASFDSSPFGFGQPFSRTQLAGLLKEAQFSAVSWSHALQIPPTKKGFVLSAASAIERVGDWITPRFSGVIIVEAVKQVYAFSSGKRVRRLVPRLRPVLLPSHVRFNGEE